MYYAYIHAKPDGIPFYIGKGHGTRSNYFYSRNQRHKNTVAKYGKDNILIGKLDCSSEAIAFDLEIGMIKCFKRMGVSLANNTAGGEGISGFLFSAESRAKMSAWQVGREMSAECKAKQSAIQKGKTVSKKTREKLSVANKGKILTQEHREKIGKANVGKKRTEELRNRISIQNTGKKKGPHSAETKAKISAGNIGKHDKNKIKEQLTVVNKTIRRVK